MSNKFDITWGADPEFFAVYEKAGKTFALPPVFFRETLGVEFVPRDNHPIFASWGNTIVHEDGAAFEMSVSPSRSWKDLFSEINSARISFSDEILSKFPQECKPELMALPSVEWEVKRWEGAGPSFDMATMFGCDADMDAYDTKTRAQVVDASKHGWRYGGGHIHMSGVPGLDSKPLLAIRSLALTAGLAATAFSDTPELDKNRIYLYGKPGKYRVQHYSTGETGIEYRTPSNRWTSNLDFATQIFKWAEIGLRALFHDNLLKEFEGDVEKSAVEAIKNADQNTAKQILSVVNSKI